ncbi:MAG: deoxyribodipyrimidine photo-lyase [Hyphomicrobiales bacterium]|nr:deoxyribodipyrimidine photo-lyase [Hyphomicrobiales bacterium]
MAEPPQIVWFKRDLRVHDHAPLAQAAARGPIIPLYIAEPGLWREPDASGRQWAFIAEALAGLGRDLAALGAPLVVRTGDAVEVLESLRAQFGVTRLWSHEETGNGWTFARDKAVAAWARGSGVEWREERQTGVIRRLKDRDGWAKKWDAFMAAPASSAPARIEGVDIDPGAIPAARDLGLADDSCPGRQAGGREAGLAELRSFLAGRGRDYRRGMSSPVTGFEQCSRLSPYLAFGAVSMRETAQATWARLRELKTEKSPDAKPLRASLVSFSGRLHWHCHFMQKLEDAPRIEFENMHRAYDGMREALDAARLAAWAEGRTGFPFVDACMRALVATGWMNFRMRAMLMAFASYHLWLPWRATGLYLARVFTDYEPGIHWSQTQMQSGTTGINTVRVYNPVKQGYDQDPTGAFVRRWVPELAALPDAFIHEPWKWDGAARLDYPPPIVDHVSAAKEAQSRIYGARRSREFYAEADAIQEKHGSRKSGLPNTGRRKRPPAAGQMALNFTEGETD